MKTEEPKFLQALCAIEDPAEMKQILGELLTPSEAIAILKRWTILSLLREGVTQREIARRIGGSLCNVTRGARLIRQKNCATVKLLDRLQSHNLQNQQQ